MIPAEHLTRALLGTPVRVATYTGDWSEGEVVDIAVHDASNPMDSTWVRVRLADGRELERRPGECVPVTG